MDGSNYEALRASRNWFYSPFLVPLVLLSALASYLYSERTTPSELDFDFAWTASLHNLLTFGHEGLHWLESGWHNLLIYGADSNPLLFFGGVSLLVFTNLGHYLWSWTPSRTIFFLLLGNSLATIFKFDLGRLEHIRLENFSFKHLKSRLTWSAFFTVLFTFKFLKVVVHTISYYLYQAVPIPPNPTITPKDVTVIIPTVGNFDTEFIDCVNTILQNRPHEIIISTVGAVKLEQVQQICAQLGTNIRCISIPMASKRAQTMHAVGAVKTRITVLADDHVFWGDKFLTSALSPFENPLVGHVGTVKRVRREHPPFLAALRHSPFAFWTALKADFLNYIACMYLERHNFECTASSNIDGGLFVISGRTALLRTSIIKDPIFGRGFLNEYWGAKGPMNVDDDNYITRYMVKAGFNTIFHNTPDALMQTTLGTNGDWTRFNGQLRRWARTTWRSNYTTLFVDRVVWKSQPWSTWAVYWNAFFNIALTYDTLLFYSLYSSDYGTGQNLWYLGYTIFISKCIKPFQHWQHQPLDIVYLPFSILFSYFHSLVRLWALLTIGDISWGTRIGVDMAAVTEDLETASTAIGRVNALFNMGEDGHRGRDFTAPEEQKLLYLLAKTKMVGAKANERAFEIERQLATLRQRELRMYV